MPRRVVTVLRWQVAVAFIVVTAVFTGTELWLGHLTHQASHLAKLDAAHVRVDDEIRRELVSRIRAQEVKTCKSRHALTSVLERVIKRSITETQGVHIPGISEQQIQDAITLDRQFLRDLARTDCRGVPPLRAPVNPPPPLPATTSG